jgi:hypothetical protein
MKVVFVEKPHSLEIREVPVPGPGTGEALIRVRAGGICGSDMHIYHGTNPLAKYRGSSDTSSPERLLRLGKACRGLSPATGWRWIPSQAADPAIPVP